MGNFNSSPIPQKQNRYDLMVCAQTGSGKTAAFLIPTAMAMREQDVRGFWIGGGFPTRF